MDEDTIHQKWKCYATGSAFFDGLPDRLRLVMRKEGLDPYCLEDRTLMAINIIQRGQGRPGTTQADDGCRVVDARLSIENGR